MRHSHMDPTAKAEFLKTEEGLLLKPQELLPKNIVLCLEDFSLFQNGV